MFIVTLDYPDSGMLSMSYGLFPTREIARAHAEVKVRCAIGTWQTDSWFEGMVNGRKLVCRIQRFVEQAC